MKSASLTLASSATSSPQVVDLTGVGTGKKKQTLTPKPPKRLKRVGTTVITRPKARTNAQQRVRTTVRGGPMKASATGQVRYFCPAREVGQGRDPHLRPQGPEDHCHAEGAGNQWLSAVQA